MVSTVQHFIQSSGNSGSQKRKRDDLTDSDEHDSFWDDSLNNESGSVDEAVDKLVNGKETPKEPANEEDNVLAELSKIYDSWGVVRNAVNTQLATPVDKMVKTMLSQDNAKEKLAKYNRRQNCENLVSTTVNPQIWWKMRSNYKSKDLRMQKIETSMLKGVHPVISSHNLCRQTFDFHWKINHITLLSFCFGFTDSYGAFCLRTKSLQTGTY